MAGVETSKIKEHMDVIAAAGEMIGKVDHLRDGKIKPTKNHSPDGRHHLVPLAWIDHIDAHVHLKKKTSRHQGGDRRRQDRRLRGRRGSRRRQARCHAGNGRQARSVKKAGLSEVGRAFLNVRQDLACGSCFADDRTLR